MLIVTFLIIVAISVATVAIVLRRTSVRQRLQAETIRRQAAEIVDLEHELVAARARLESAESTLDERVRTVIQDASARAYRETNASFLELAGTKLEGTVAPLRDSLKRVNEQVQELDRARAQGYGALGQQLADLSERTAALTTALRSPHVRGRWGEIQLRRVVELAGMLPYCDFSEQVTTATEDGRLRPDLIVRMPGGKQVVVDAKVPLTAYLDATEATDEAVRAQKLADHARQVRDHLQKLGEKRYWQQFADSPDYVVMFLPDEGFFRAAWEQDRELVELGVRARVHIASPTTLIALLQAIAYGWQQEKVAQDARLIHELGGKLYDGLAVMGGHLNRIGSSLEKAVGSYNDTVGSLERNVLPKGRQLKAHITSDKDLKEPERIELRTRPLVASELTGGPPPLEILPGDADAA